MLGVAVGFVDIKCEVENRVGECGSAEQTGGEAHIVGWQRLPGCQTLSLAARGTMFELR